MKIKKLETFTKSFVSFVKVTTDTNEVGYGQVSTYHSDITAQIFHKQINLHFSIFVNFYSTI